MNGSHESRHIACHHCDHISTVPQLEPDHVALCPVCDGLLAESQYKDQHEYVLPMAISALVLLALSFPFNFISFSRQGLVQSIKLLDAAEMMLQYGQPFLAVLINLTIILLPASIVMFIILQRFRLITLLPHRIHIMFTKAIFRAKEWSMPEIFLAGVLVSLVKIVSLAEVSIGMSFWAYTGFVICFILTITKLDKMALWDEVSHHSNFTQNHTNRRAIDVDLAVCPECDVLTHQDQCPRCDTSVIVRDPLNLQKTIALTITAALLYIPANLYPIMTTVFLSDPQPSTIIGGVVLLWHHESYPVALVIFVASVMLPMAKLCVLVLLTWVVKLRPDYSRHSFTLIYAITEFLGKWSMVDVFVVAILVALIHLSGIMEVIPGPGAIFFSAMVITSMLAAHTFDPRQLWDSERKESVE